MTKKWFWYSNSLPIVTFLKLLNKEWANFVALFKFIRTLVPQFLILDPSDHDYGDLLLRGLLLMVVVSDNSSIVKQEFLICWKTTIDIIMVGHNNSNHNWFPTSLSLFLKKREAKYIISYYYNTTIVKFINICRPTNQTLVFGLCKCSS